MPVNFSSEGSHAIFLWAASVQRTCAHTNRLTKKMWQGTVWKIGLFQRQSQNVSFWNVCFCLKIILVLLPFSHSPLCLSGLICSLNLFTLTRWLSFWGTALGDEQCYAHCGTLLRISTWHTAGPVRARSAAGRNSLLAKEGTFHLQVSVPRGVPTWRPGAWDPGDCMMRNGDYILVKTLRGTGEKIPCFCLRGSHFIVWFLGWEGARRSGPFTGHIHIPDLTDGVINLLLLILGTVGEDRLEGKRCSVQLVAAPKRVETELRVT